MTREELLELGIYAPTKFSDQIEAHLILGNTVLFKCPYLHNPHTIIMKPVLVKLAPVKGVPCCTPDWGKELEFLFNVRDCAMTTYGQLRWGIDHVHTEYIRPKDVKQFISYLYDR